MPLVQLRAKPVKVDAVQFTGDVHDVNLALLGRQAYGNVPCLRPYPGNQTYPAVHAKDGVVAEVWNGADRQWQPVTLGDWIIRGTDGNFYAAPAQVVADKYDVVG